MSQPAEDAAFFTSRGRCPVCEAETEFLAKGPYFRNTMRCATCGAAPRHCALMYAVKLYFPHWKTLRIHEGSPGWDSIAQRLVRECPGYAASHYDTSVPFGTIVESPQLPCRQYRSENLEGQTFADGAFDLVILQDVLEHVFHPDRAIREISRTLAPGGALLMTVPLVQGMQQSRRRAVLKDGEVEHLLPRETHGNPLSGGALVTIDWGYDIVAYLSAHAPDMVFSILAHTDDTIGIKGTLTEVVAGFKLPLPTLEPCAV